MIVLMVTLTSAVMRGYLLQNEPVRAYLQDIVSKGDWEDPCALQSHWNMPSELSGEGQTTR